MAEVAQLRIIRFGQFEVDARAGELRKSGVRIKLQQQPLEILLALLDRPGEVVTREELRQRLWPQDTFVDFDHSLNAAIKRLRDALGDSADKPVFIETMARRGYRFIYPVNGPVPAIAAPKGRVIRKWQVIASAAILVIAGLGVGWFVARSVRHKPLTERRLTANSGEAALITAAISPDGKLLAYADATGMYLRHVDTGEIRSLPLPAGFDLMSVKWFPDNSHLAITGIAGAGEKPSFWQMSTMSGSFRRLIDEARKAVVSPDGVSIAFVREGASEARADREIWIVQSAGTNPRRLLQIAPDEWFGSIVWSPDGQYVAYLKVREGPAYTAQISIETVAVAGGPPRILFTRPLLRDGFVWSPDGRIFYSTSSEALTTEDSAIWSVAVDPLTGKAKGEPVQIARQPGWISEMSITSDGKRLALLRRNTLPQVFIAEYEAGASRLKMPRRLTLDDSVNAPFSWTPDSKAVFFPSSRSGTWNIFKQAIDQPTAELFAGGRDQHFGPRLSPDGREVFYLAAPGTDPNAPVTVMRMPVGGGPAQAVFKEPGIVDLQCARAPSRLCLALKVGRGETVFYPFDPTTGREKEFRLPYGGGGSLSPDGSQLAFPEFNEKLGRIRFFSLATNQWRDVVVKGRSGFKSFDWSPDGKTMFVAASNSGDTASLLEIDSQGNARELLQGQIDWAIPSPDGHYLAVNEAVGTNNVWMLENF